MLEVVEYVNSWYSLAALIAMLIASLVHRIITKQERLIEKTSVEKRHELVSLTLEINSINTHNLTKEQQYKIAIKLIHERSIKQKRTLYFLSFIFLLLTVLLFFLIPPKGDVPALQVKKFPNLKELSLTEAKNKVNLTFSNVTYNIVRSPSETGEKLVTNQFPTFGALLNSEKNITVTIYISISYQEIQACTIASSEELKTTRNEVKNLNVNAGRGSFPACVTKISVGSEQLPLPDSNEEYVGNPICIITAAELKDRVHIESCGYDESGRPKIDVKVSGHGCPESNKGSFRITQRYRHVLSSSEIEQIEESCLNKVDLVNVGNSEFVRKKV